MKLALAAGVLVAFAGLWFGGAFAPSLRGHG